MTAAQIASLLSRIGESAVSAAPALPGTAGLIVGGIGAGIALAGDLITLERDPVVQINAIRDLDPDLAKLRAERERARQSAVEKAAAKAAPSTPNTP